MTRVRQFFLGAVAATLQTAACVAADNQALRAALLATPSVTATLTADRPLRMLGGA
ncbi:hypothetical protein [Kluyvera georgiana]|uniref:hypothetical protein n=1 Tax=Kluyvera georgiana TaxID=73098 RepID=UPI0032207E7C